MSRKIVVLSLLLAVVAPGAFALGRFYGPARGLGAMAMVGMGPWMLPGMSYGMHPGMMPGGWMGMVPGGMWGMGLVWLAIWTVPVAIVAALIVWLVRPRPPENKGQ